MATKVILDCDPGYDDALAILVALGAPEIELLAITTVAGNAPLDRVTENALRIATLAGAEGLTIAAGAARPLARPLRTARDVHGTTGLVGPALPAATLTLDRRPALDVTAEILSAHEPGSVTLVPIGPLTNIAYRAARPPVPADRRPGARGRADGRRRGPR